MSQPIRGQRRISKVLDRLTSDEDVSSDELFDDILEELGRVLVGWKNMNGLEYSKEALEDTLTFTEARELVRLVGYNAHITTEEKKSSE
ncbi:MAG TPA: hypothetical protein VM260_19250 [Pirellula sp.]|nr:hypothetical protein [Pirellula sp.]